VPPQDIISRDHVSLKANAIIYFQVMDAPRAMVEAGYSPKATPQLPRTTLRSVLGQVDWDDLPSRRETFNVKLQEILDQHTDAWGIKAGLVEVEQTEAATGEKREIRHADGECQTAAQSAEAAGIINWMQGNPYVAEAPAFCRESARPFLEGWIWTRTRSRF
jgi:hypothetical protein